MILLILFLPVAIYLIWVGGISRHSRPSIVGGSWDFVALMFAGSGLVLVGLPAVITSIYETWRRYWLTGEGPIPYSSLEGSRWFWLFIWLVYFVMTLSISAILIYRKRSWTCFYNVDPEVLILQSIALWSNPLVSIVNSGIYTFFIIHMMTRKRKWKLKFFPS